ncbi:cell wall-binding repeat-containing protein [Stomatohabitans albus]|uniref:cell wall-binding repeat-containing protein n=1 Tax=Stomatohabitans albus TaxID=3110766 RepID=UPI00300D08E9
MATPYSHTRRLNAVKALAALAIIITLILMPQVLKAELMQQLQRFEGDSRVETSVAISRSLIPYAQLRDRIVVATADDFADAQAATPLAVRAGTAILITPGDFLHHMVKHELQRVLRPGSTVYLAGGQRALSERVQESISELGFNVVRLAGETRVETAIALAEQATHLGTVTDEQVSRVFVVSGHTFAPGLITSSRAARDGGLMVIGDAGIAWAKTNYPSTPITVVGDEWTHLNGIKTVPVEDVRTLVDRLPGERSQTMALASLNNFPDALSGGVHAATTNRDLILVEETPTAELGTWLRSHYILDCIAVYGGQAALPDSAVWTLTQ